MQEYMVNVDELKKDNDEKKYELGLANQRITQFEILHNSENKEDRVNVQFYYKCTSNHLLFRTISIKRLRH